MELKYVPMVDVATPGKEALQAAETDAHEPPCDAALGEVYHVHVTIHGPNKLLPVDALPTCPSVREQVQPGADQSLH